jgi:hypothetical protein
MSSHTTKKLITEIILLEFALLFTILSSTIVASIKLEVSGLCQFGSETPQLSGFETIV